MAFQAEAQAAAAAHDPTCAKLRLRERSDLRALDDILDDFLSLTADEPAQAPAESWGEKVGPSVFDDEAVLGRYDRHLDYFVDDWHWRVYLLGTTAPPSQEEQEGAEEEGSEEESDSNEESDDYVEDDLEIDSDGEELEELAAYYDGNFDFSVEDRSIYSGKDDNLSNAAMLIQPSCCVSNLECDLPEGCPICLESLEAGQRAWTLPCTHVLHEVCLLRFLRSRHAKSRCPLCRCDMRRNGAASSVPPAEGA